MSLVSYFGDQGGALERYRGTKRSQQAHCAAFASGAHSLWIAGTGPFDPTLLSRVRKPMYSARLRHGAMAFCKSPATVLVFCRRKHRTPASFQSSAIIMQFACIGRRALIRFAPMHCRRVIAIPWAWAPGHWPFWLRWRMTRLKPFLPSMKPNSWPNFRILSRPQIRADIAAAREQRFCSQSRAYPYQFLGHWPCHSFSGWSTRRRPQHCGHRQPHAARTSSGTRCFDAR